MKSSGDVLNIHNVCFAYGTHSIIERVTFALHPGDFAILIGGNGAGKSTLMKLILGELLPTSGSVRLFAEETASFCRWTKVGYVPQQSVAGALEFPATALEIVRSSLYAQIGRFRPAGPRHTRLAMEALDRVDMGAYARHMFSQLSGGQQQRVMLARVLAAGPRLLLLDEPTTGMDAASSHQLYTLLGRLCRHKGLTILMITHDLAAASAEVTRTFCLENGSLIELERQQVIHELSHRHTHPPGNRP